MTGAQINAAYADAKSGMMRFALMRKYSISVEQADELVKRARGSK